MGGTPVGAPLIGWVGEEFGARWTILLGGIVAMITALLSVVWLQRTGRVHIRAQAAWPFLVVDEPAVPAVSAAVEPVMADGAEGAAAGPLESSAGDASAPVSAEGGVDRDATGDVRGEKAPSARVGTQEARNGQARTKAARADAGDTISAA
jgi:hypothetical protein